MWDNVIRSQTFIGKISIEYDRYIYEINISKILYEGYI